jgi:peptidyl-prolyl cis-trans isomerase SurA
MKFITFFYLALLKKLFFFQHTVRSNKQQAFQSLLWIISACFISTHVFCEENAFVDSVIASVDGEPITLLDLVKKTKKKLSLKEAATDLDSRKALDELIVERVITLEAAKRKLSAPDEDIDGYLKEIASKNSLTKEEFIAALKEQGKSLQEYKEFVKYEILKSKLTSILLRGSSAVSDEEIESYLKENPREMSTGSKLELRRILLKKETHSKEDAYAALNDVIEKVRDDDESFENTAKSISEGPEKEEGGKIGSIDEKDLSPEIFDAVLSLKDKKPSAIVDTIEGYQVFYIDKRIQKGNKKDIENQMKEQIRKQLEQEKLEKRFANFFTDELLVGHSIDRKI